MGKPRPNSLINGWRSAQRTLTFQQPKKRGGGGWSLLMAQWVKEPAMSLLWHQVHPWPWNFHVVWVQPKKGRGGGCSLTENLSLLSSSLTCPAGRRRGMVISGTNAPCPYPLSMTSFLVPALYAVLAREDLGMLWAHPGGVRLCRHRRGHHPQDIPHL